MTKSIRTKLTLWYALVLAAILLLFCLVLYVSISYALNRQVNHSLRKYTHNLADNYQPESDRFRDLPEQDFLTNPLLWFRIVRDDGSLFRPAPTFQIFQRPFPIQQAQSLPAETARFETFTLGTQSFRSIIFPVDIAGKRVGWIQLVRPITDVVRTLKTIRTSMSFLVLLAVVLLSAGGHLLARKTLRPIESIRQQVAEIYEQNLSRRIRIMNPEDELGLLTRTFNQMLERLQAAFESQRRFLADASHEIKTPITILRSQWEKIAETRTLPAHLRKEIQRDLEELARLAKLVDNLLLLSEIDDNRVKIEQKPVDLAEVLHEVYEDAKILAEQKHQSTRLIIREPAVILGDRSRLVQLFLDLIDNAVKYTPPGGEISLLLRKQNNKACVNVEDTGIGVSERDLARIFDRFYRADKSRSRQLGGSGLGLSICQWIVNAHQGKIEIRSEVGKGTNVLIEFACQ